MSVTPTDSLMTRALALIDDVVEHARRRKIATGWGDPRFVYQIDEHVMLKLRELRIDLLTSDRT